MAQTPARKSATKAAKSTTKGDPKSEQPKFKAIWEPVNVKEDLELRSVHFVTADEGWVAGGRSVMQGGVILHTKDGGANWEVQLGDPQSSDRSYGDLRFAGPKVGFAVQSTGVGDHQLLRMTEGQNWAPSGTVGQHRNDYRFISADVGFYTHGADLHRTQNGGGKWERVYQCRVKAEIFRTTDGGKTWTGVPGRIDGKPDIQFADAEVGWMVRYNTMMYTTDGGKSWISRNIAFPAGVTAFSLVQRDRGYAVGPHGMVYRYRIVPFDYTSKGMLAAPAMSAR